MVDEITFARLEKAVKQAISAATYIKQLELEKEYAGKVFDKDKELKEANQRLDSARLATINALQAALAATERADLAQQRATETAKKDLEKTREDLKKQRKYTFWATLAAIAAILVASR